MKLTCPYLPSTTTPRLPRACARAAPASAEGTAVSTSGHRRNAQSAGPTRVRTPVMVEKSGSSDAFCTARTAVAPPLRTTMKRVRR